MFRVLVVDDDPTMASLFKQLARDLPNPPEIYFALDGEQALDFLRGRGRFAGCPKPDLILLDMNMPRLGGLETLSRIKTDDKLRVIPIIVLSSSSDPEIVCQSYEAYANGYVLKPTDLERTQKLVQALEAFWIEFAVRPVKMGRIREIMQSIESKVKSNTSAAPLRAMGAGCGQTFAVEGAEVSSQVHVDDSVVDGAATKALQFPCEEHKRLLDAYGEAVRAVLDLHEQQFLAIVDGDTESNRFDLLIHMANERKLQAKYAYLRHTDAHGC